ncbi:hypothetical protein CVT26_002510 [Gymnopilus dilepis]|uniref:Uncharacterized protein n=1 Tax=Gymnopilus dilepis TaxID=231916 RepID=A0A409YN89_9AGAR|nr:hypothetical protein CVT26_002510 [Gymnopilus dilepis]
MDGSQAMPDYISSGEILPEWTGLYTVSSDAAIQLDSLLKAAFLKPEANPPDDLFDLSPLTSPESSAPSTPSTSRSTTASHSPSLQRMGAGPPCSPSSHISHGITSAPSPANATTPSSHPFSAELLAAKLDAVAQARIKKPRPSRALTKAQKKRKVAQKARCRDIRKKQRLDASEASYSNRTPPGDARERYRGAAEPIFMSTNTKRAKVAGTGFVGLDRGSFPSGVVFLDDLVGEGSKYKFLLQKWDGRTPMLVVDRDGRIIAILAGRPEDPTWNEVQREAAQLLEEARCACRVPKKSQHHRRGAFTTLRCGFSHGGGQTSPQNLLNSKTNARVIDRLNNSTPMRRIAGFGSSVFQSWAPDLHQYYVDKLGALQQRDPTLKRPFQNSVFSSTTYNLGPRTVCEPHLDFANLPFGYCAITALGDFDPVKGGHIVLWECKLVVEFPPGSTILIPSSIIHHSNVAVAKDEVRYSATQYAAGGLFRWAEHGFQLTEAYRASLTPFELAELDRRNEHRWAVGLSLMPRLPSVSTL